MLENVSIQLPAALGQEPRSSRKTLASGEKASSTRQLFIKHLTNSFVDDTVFGKFIQMDLKEKSDFDPQRNF